VAIARVALPVRTDRLFDYWLPHGLRAEAGSVVRVKLAGRRMLGVVMDIVQRTPLQPEQLVAIDELAAELSPLPEDLRALAHFVARYYQQPIGQCLAELLPPLGAGRGSTAAPLAAGFRLSEAGRSALAAASAAGGVPGHRLREAFAAGHAVATAEIRSLGDHAWRTFRAWLRKGWVEAAPEAIEPRSGTVQLNDEQRNALGAVLPTPPAFAASLLQGVTGSGKTEVYLAAIARVVDTGRQALLLVPEIHLTPQLEQRVAAALPQVRVATLHSALSRLERRRRWLAAARGETELVLGTRLAVFAPLPRLGLIVVDEEHDASFRQMDGVRYHARDLAVYRARLRQVPVVLGSATPSLESYAHARRGHYRWLRLSRRANPQSTLPVVQLVGNRDAGSDGFGAALRVAISERLARREQSLLFINRRGFAPSLLCVACGWKAMCSRCTARLVLHRDAGELRCHHCGHTEGVPSACRQCGNRDLFPVGFGTQRLEAALQARFPQARVLRVDRDTTRRGGAFATMRLAIAEGEVDILVGTQMLAKGHHFPRVTLVGVLGPDNALYSADFRATERLFALLEQVAGRAGRGALRGEVIVQTDFPQHPLFEALVRHDYDHFAEALLAERRSLRLPPFGHLALLAAEARTRSAVNAFLERAAARGQALADGGDTGCELYPPVAAALGRRAGMERGQILVQSAKRRALQGFLTLWRTELERLGPRTVRWNLEVDPLALA
jgi:primosomal protein N' (replication factor Y)